MVTQTDHRRTSPFLIVGLESAKFGQFGRMTTMILLSFRIGISELWASIFDQSNFLNVRLFPSQCLLAPSLNATQAADFDPKWE